MARVAGPVGANADGNSILSEWGANLTVVAPGGGQYWGNKAAGQRLNDGRPMRGAPTTAAAPAIVPIATTDWTINQAAKPPTATTPAIPELFGLNKGGGTGTTEYANGNYTRRFQGTSAAAAHVSGVVALMLEANPRLSWIDVQNILIRTARNHLDPLGQSINALDGLDIADPADPVVIDRDWERNGGGLWFNHKYGAGLVDAGRAVAVAEQGFLLPPQSAMRSLSAISGTRLTIADATATAPGAIAEMLLSPDGAGSNFVVTHVQVRIEKIVAPAIGELGIVLVAPSGMQSTLLEPRFDFSDDMTNWTFSSLRSWGENPEGTWKLQFRDYFRDDAPSQAALMKVNTPRPGEANQNPRVTLVVHGYDLPSIPRVKVPESVDSDAPTVVNVPRNRGFSYALQADNNPTAWVVAKDSLPPGLRVEEIPPSADTTYVPRLTILGTTNAAVGTSFPVEVMAANAAGASETHYLSFVIVPTTDSYTPWASYYWPAPPSLSTNPLAKGEADSDGDGYSNVLEYGLGTSPTVPDLGQALAIVPVDGVLAGAFGFNRYPDREVKYELEVSDSLETGKWEVVMRSDPSLVPPSAGAAGKPVNLAPTRFAVTEGEKVAAGVEPQSAHFPVTVTPIGEIATPLFYRIRVIPLRDPLDPK